jgi:hypothetical protein
MAHDNVQKDDTRHGRIHAPIVSLGCHFYNLPLLRTSSTDDTIPWRGPGIILAIRERTVAIVLDLIGTITEQINVPLRKVVN